MKIHLWTPGMDASHGGIQAYSSEIFQSLLEIYGEKNIFASSLHGAPSLHRNVRDFGKYPAPMRKPLFALNAAVLAIAQRPDLLFLTHANLCPLARWVHRITGIPYVVGIHGFELNHLHGATGEVALMDAKQVFPVSNWTRGLLLKKFPLLETRCTVFPNTFDAKKFQPGEKSPALLGRYHLPLDAKIILTVARLSSQERYKGVEEMIQAMPAVLAACPNAYYLVVGRGDDLERLQKLAVTCAVQHRVIFCGYVPDTELRAHYRLCDVYAMPSRGEGFGITYLEALACGKPVLAGSLDASREALLEGKLGIIVDPTDIPEIAAALITLLDKNHPNPQLFDPLWLRTEAIAAFGREHFTERLRNALTIS